MRNEANGRWTEAVRHLSGADRRLKKLIERVGPCTLKPRERCHPYESLVRAVTYQQLNGTAAATIFSRFKALFPGVRFPRPEQVVAAPDELLRSAGLSRAKTAAIKDLAAKRLEGVVPGSREIRKLGDSEIVERLIAVRGVGPWTVEMLLIFTLGRPDVMPATDYGVQKGFSLVYGWKELPRPKELMAGAEPWRPYRSVAAWYLWRALELPRAGNRPAA